MSSTVISHLAKAATLLAVAASLAVGMAGTAAASSGTTYGDPVAAGKYWSHQHYDDCAIMSSADAVGQVTGTTPAEEAIIRIAETTPSATHAGSIYIKPADTSHPNSGNGTMLQDLPTLLKQYKVDSVISDKDAATKTGIKAGMEGIEVGHGVGEAAALDHQPVGLVPEQAAQADRDQHPDQRDVEQQVADLAAVPLLGRQPAVAAVQPEVPAGQKRGRGG